MQEPIIHAESTLETQGGSRSFYNKSARVKAAQISKCQMRPFDGTGTQTVLVEHSEHFPRFSQRRKQCSHCGDQGSGCAFHHMARVLEFPQPGLDKEVTYNFLKVQVLALPALYGRKWALVVFAKHFMKAVIKIRPKSFLLMFDINLYSPGDTRKAVPPQHMMKNAEDQAMEIRNRDEKNVYVNMCDLETQKRKDDAKTKAAKRTNRLILVLVVLLIFLFLLLVVVTGILFTYYKNIAEEQSHLRNNVMSAQEKIENLTGSLSSDNHRIWEVVGNLVDKLWRGNGTTLLICEAGWVYYWFSCYHVSSNVYKWNDSKTDCENRNAQLVVINDEREMNFLLTISEKTKTWWIGLTEADGSWRWVDGTSYEMTPKLWLPHQPDNHSGGEDCAELKYGKGWNDAHCSNKSPYICEKRIL
ncbi:uncharacterized protein ACMZJ9_003484 [Mantella aurantiaca]